MKKGILLTLCAAMALSSCGTYTGSGAATGATFGTILGSAIGGITGAPRLCHGIFGKTGSQSDWQREIRLKSDAIWG